MQYLREQTAVTYPAPIFEGFFIQMLKPGMNRKLRKAINLKLGVSWQISGVGDDPTDFEVTQKRIKGTRALSVKSAWEKTYGLRAQPGVIYAEPMFTVPISGPPEFREEAREDRGGITSGKRRAGEKRAAGERALFSGKEPLPESNDPDWSLRELKVLKAWKRFFPDADAGKGVLIGHPDTGYSKHPEIAARLTINKGYDFVRNDSDAKDDLDQGVLLFPGHGTGTASVIVSPQDAQDDYGQIGNKPIAVWGVAPGAELMPLRVSRSVVLDVPWAGGGALNLARAIEHAADQKAHIVSISMGSGFKHERLLKAVQYAQKRGVIVLAAAGNYVNLLAPRYVVWPAAYTEVIAVAASNAQHKTWKYSSRGSAVDVTAPGESVWCAGINDQGKFTVGRGSGTSFAVASVAGVAALWLAHHGRDNLIQRYGAEKIPVIFNRILRDTCDPMPGWGPEFGRGLVNAEKVLAAPLPGEGDPIPPPAFAFRDHPAIDNGGVATFAHLFEPALTKGNSKLNRARAVPENAKLAAKLAELLRTTEENLPARLREVGQELAFHFAVNPELYQQFEAALAGQKRGGATRSKGLAAAPEASVNQTRAMLLTKGASQALKERVTKSA